MMPLAQAEKKVGALFPDFKRKRYLKNCILFEK